MTAADAEPARRGAGARIAFVLGLVFLALALLAVAYAAAAGREGVWTAAGELWYRLNVGSLNLTQAVIQRHVVPYLWDPVVVSALLWPAWGLFAVPGLVLTILFAPRRPPAAGRGS